MNDKRPSGGARLTEKGYRPVLLGLKPDDHDILKRAALSERRPLTQFLLFHGLEAAKKIMRKSGN